MGIAMWYFILIYIQLLTYIVFSESLLEENANASNSFPTVLSTVPVCNTSVESRADVEGMLQHQQSQ